ncbi:MAG: RsmB/NOP family class I SAM-dependent RNA methyltransferase [Bacteroidetes bacterium]|nr:RsmB/NOP family class I SAM-dependent RNA methyltransferase [Bacteroidota bacterium]
MHSYIHTSLAFLREFDGSMPLHHFLRNQFRKDKKYGSRDRRWIKEICYAWFRTVSLLKSLPDEKRIYWAFYLINEQRLPIVELILQSGGEEFAGKNPEEATNEKLNQLRSVYPECSNELIFPFENLTSALLNRDTFSLAMLQQPKVWIRVKSTAFQKTESALNKAGIPFERHKDMENAWSIDPASKLEETGIFEKGMAEIQDLSSQKTATMMDAKAGERWLDACAASGGKSLLLLDKVPGVILTVSDNRKAILENLKERFRRNGWRNYTMKLLDLTSSEPNDFYNQKFDGIIADVPCSGSGTWPRSPEQMNFFTEEKLNHYISLQDSISARLAGMLKPGGKLIYITCSVFKAENEDRVDALIKDHGLVLSSMQLFQGATEGADTLFCARLLKM